MTYRMFPRATWFIGGILLFTFSFLTLRAYDSEGRSASSSAIPAAQSAPEKESLKGLRGVSVVIEQIRPNVQNIITSEQARAVVEARLRLNAVPILSKEEVLNIKGAGHLYLKLKILKAGTANQYSYSWQLQLLQRVSLDRDSSFKMLAPTWNRDDMGFASGALAAMDLREGIKDVVDRFCSDYRVNN